MDDIMGRRLDDLTIPNATLPTGARRLRLEWGSEFFTLVRYYGEQRVRVNGHAGSLFTVGPAHMTDEVRALREKYSNVLILAGHSQYAPEQSHGYVFVADRRLTEKG